MSRLDERLRKKIRKEFKKNGSIRTTAKTLHISRNAVRRELRGSNRMAPRTPRRPSKLDPYKAKIKYLVEEKSLSAVRVMEEIEELGFDGGYTILKDYVRTIRPRGWAKPTSPIDHAPGQEGQMDWSPHRVILGGREQIVHTGSILLCFSRWLYMHFFLDEKIERVMALHRAAFEELGALPETMTYDNMTTVGFHRGPGDVWINPTFKAFADDYGFTPIILTPGSKDRHGAVERPFHYIEHNFLAGREFHDLEDINRRGDRWRWGTANVRIHGTLRERPDDRLERERPFLKTLPSHKVDAKKGERERLIHKDFCIALLTNRYSAHPKHVGKYAMVHLYEDRLEIWVDGKMDCRHTYCEGTHQRNVLPEHENAYRKMTGQRALLEKAFLRLGDAARSYYEGLTRERGTAAGYHLQRILKMADRHGADVVGGAMAYAQRFGAYSAEAVLRIIHGKALKRKGRPLAESAPENVRQWLRACNVESTDLDSYDRMIDQLSLDMNDENPNERTGDDK